MHPLLNRRNLIIKTGVAIFLIAQFVIAPASVAPVVADEVEDARREVGRVQSEVAAVRRQYDLLVNQVSRAQTDLDSRQSQIVNLSLELNRKQEVLNQRSAEFANRVRQTYKDGPDSDVRVFLASESLGQFWAARRYVAARLQRDRELLAEMQAEQDDMEFLSHELESGRAAIQSQLEALADLLGQTQELLAGSEAALAASQADLQVKEEMRKAMELINRGSAGGRRPVSEKHRRATENQTEVLKRYPFGPVAGIPAGLAPTGETVEGIASWYGPGFNGLPTASGAIYDESLYTCASKELALGTILLVTHKDRSVLLLVNDRGPFVKGRVLDLSRAAKDAIGMGGLGYVSAQVLEPL